MTLPLALILAAMVAAVWGLFYAIDGVDAGRLACVAVLCLAAAYLAGAV